MKKGERTTHCIKGHLRTEENTYTYPNGVTRCRECMRMAHRKLRAKPEKWAREKENLRKFNKERKIEVLTHYGFQGTLRCCWRGCFITDVDMLSLDHIANDGATHRASLLNVSSKGGGGSVVYADVKRRNFPEGFETLCCNHQMKKEIIRRTEVAEVNMQAEVRLRCP